MTIDPDNMVRRSETPFGETSVGPNRARVQLFVVGGSANSRAAETNLKSFLAAHPELGTDLELIDVRDNPEAALSAGVFVTPTLIRKVGDNNMIAVGNLHDDAALFELFS